MRTRVRRTIAWAGRHWGFPGNVHFWWTVGIPAVPAVMAGIIAFVREAPLWQVAGLVVCSYLVAFGITAALGPQRTFRWRRRAKKLKQPALRLSDELFQFAQERDEAAPQSAPIQAGDGLWDTIRATFSAPETWERAQEKTRHDEETRAQYSQRYAGDVARLLEELEQRGWLDPKERKQLQDGVENPFLSPTYRIRQVAERIDAIGKGL